MWNNFFHCWSASLGTLESDRKFPEPPGSEGERICWRLWWPAFPAFLFLPLNKSIAAPCCYSFHPLSSMILYRYIYTYIYSYEYIFLFKKKKKQNSQDLRFWPWWRREVREQEPSLRPQGLLPCGTLRPLSISSICWCLYKADHRALSTVPLHWQYVSQDHTDP